MLFRSICPNAYYNYRKHRKADYDAQKETAKALIREIYHAHNGVAGYRTMSVYLARRGCHYSAVTVHKYMNTEMKLYSLVRPKRPGYRRVKPHKVFENRLRQDFRANHANQKWCTDLTYGNGNTVLRTYVTTTNLLRQSRQSNTSDTGQ